MTIPNKMTAVLLTGHGGFEKLDYRHDVGVPSPKDDEVLIKVNAAGMNNTDINTRIGWYSKQITTATGSGGSDGYNDIDNDDAGWSGTSLQLSLIHI